MKGWMLSENNSDALFTKNACETLKKTLHVFVLALWCLCDKHLAETIGSFQFQLDN